MQTADQPIFAENIGSAYSHFLRKLNSNRNLFSSKIRVFHFFLGTVF